MTCIFSTVRNHIVTAAGRNVYTIPLIHPSRKISEHDFIYVIDGKFEVGVGENVFTVEKDQVLILPANVFHYGVAPCAENTKTFFIHATFESGDGYTSMPTIAMSDNRIYLNNLIDVSKNPNVKNYFIRTVEEKISNNENKATAFLNLLLCELFDASQIRTPKENLAVQIKQMIDANLDKNLSIEEIADKFHISSKTASSLFKNHFGLSIHQYTLQRKLEQSKFYLEYYPQMQIREISQIFSFYDEYHYSKQFKKYYNISPSQYRSKKISSAQNCCP